MQGKINGIGNLTGRISSAQSMDGRIVGKQSMSGTAHIPSAIPMPEYDGSYEATPTAEIQIFATANKKMNDNFTVNATPYSEVSNLSGGYTATIL